MKDPKKLTAHLLSAVTSTAVLLPPVVVTAVISTARLVTESRGDSVFWDVFCFLVVLLCWTAAAILPHTRFLGRPLPKTGVVICGILLISVLLFAVSYAMEEDIFSPDYGIWAVGRLFGGVCYVSAAGFGRIFGNLEPGTAAMLTGAVYLMVGLIAGLPWGKK